jgi:hypothetical protein
MQRIIYLLGPELPGYAVDQAHLISRYLPADQFSSELVVPGRAGSVELAALPTTSIAAGLAGLIDLRRLCTAAPPACVHAWGMSAARLLAILLRGRWCTRGVGSFLVPAATVGSLAALGGWLTRRLIAPLPAPAVPWAVECPAEPIPQRELTTLGIPAKAELIVALGDHTRTGNLNTAVWAFDVLRYIHPRAWLVIIGRGPRRDRTERFARAVAREDYRVRFVDVPFAQISRWCQRASVVWVTRAAAVVAVGVWPGRQRVGRCWPWPPPKPRRLPTTTREFCSWPAAAAWPWSWPIARGTCSNRPPSWLAWANSTARRCSNSTTPPPSRSNGPGTTRQAESRSGRLAVGGSSQERLR